MGTEASEMSVELAARMPWLHALPGSWWEVTGTTGPKHRFKRCLARVLPEFVTGSDTPTFEVLVYGAPFYCTASAITRAVELLLVYADEPRRAYNEEDQDSLDLLLESLEASK